MVWPPSSTTGTTSEKLFGSVSHTIPEKFHRYLERMSSITSSARLALVTFGVPTSEAPRLPEDLGHHLSNGLVEKEVGNRHFFVPQRTESLTIKPTCPF